MNISTQLPFHADFDTVESPSELRLRIRWHVGVMAFLGLVALGGAVFALIGAIPAMRAMGSVAFFGAAMAMLMLVLAMHVDIDLWNVVRHRSAVATRRARSVLSHHFGPSASLSTDVPAA